MSVFLQLRMQQVVHTWIDRLGPRSLSQEDAMLLIITVAEPTESLALFTFILCVCPSRSSQLTSLFRAIWWSSNIIQYKKM